MKELSSTRDRGSRVLDKGPDFISANNSNNVRTVTFAPDPPEVRGLPPVEPDMPLDNNIMPDGLMPGQMVSMPGPPPGPILQHARPMPTTTPPPPSYYGYGQY